jgi:hypothetical protein
MMAISSALGEDAMRERTQTCTAVGSAPELWDYLASYDRVIRLSSKTASARLESGSAESGDARYRVSVFWEGLQTKYVACLSDAERPRTLTWKTKSGQGQSWIRFDLKPVDEFTTAVTVTLHHEPNASSKALEPFLWGQLRPMFERTLRKLHEPGLLQRSENVPQAAE